ncbi:RNA polymerase II transcription factor SIII subunit A2 [Cricetulus griseus]|uniref:RNA polymerase II transcription factor SIII subunit A2 n=1 Tax=Cricetulus griseus TaxID=10029 RepID=G3INS7_CRIGR|nr:RNA polymerase II transcription factor SIII subunit A2 [Cricetulus griseus]
MEIEPTRRLEALLNLRERLCRETEPRQLYKTLKKLCSQPMLGDILEEIGFRQKIKLLKKQQILVPFAKELAARWSEQSQFGSQPNPGPPQDFPFHKSPEAEIPSNSPEDELQNPAFLRPRENGSQVLEVSSSSPQHSTTESMDTSSLQIATGSPNVESAGRRTQTHRENQLDTESQHQEDSPGTHMNTAQRTGSQSESQTHLKMQESLQLRLQALCARIQNTQTKKPHGRQTKTVAFQDQEDTPGTHMNTAQRSGSQSQSQKHLKMQDSLQLRLQALCTRIQNTQIKKLHGRQTKTVAFQAQVTRSREHADSGPGPEASIENVQSLPEASGPGLLQRAPSPRLGVSSIGSNTTRAKKPAPLMDKALKDYKKWWFRK